MIYLTHAIPAIINNTDDLFNFSFFWKKKSAGKFDILLVKLSEVSGILSICMHTWIYTKMYEVTHAFNPILVVIITWKVALFSFMDQNIVG